MKAAALLGFLLALPLTAAAALKAMSLEDLVRESPLIISGTVKSLRVERLPKTRELWTIALVTPDTWVAGKSPEVLPVRVMGGKTPEGSQIVPDSPVIAPEERVVLFLEPDPNFPGDYRVVGWRLGKFSVDKDGWVAERNQPVTGFVNVITDLRNKLVTKNE